MFNSGSGMIHATVTHFPSQFTSLHYVYNVPSDVANWKWSLFLSVQHSAKWMSKGFAYQHIMQNVL